MTTKTIYILCGDKSYDTMSEAQAALRALIEEGYDLDYSAIEEWEVEDEPRWRVCSEEVVKTANAWNLSTRVSGKFPFQVYEVYCSDSDFDAIYDHHSLISEAPYC